MTLILEEAIRQRLNSRTRRTLEEPHFRRAAVLVPLFEADGEAHLVFTKRSDTVDHHKGQVSFPGAPRHPGPIRPPIPPALAHGSL